ncbi:hypothetical protein FRC06_007345, partial [Ceratobasidium sp. 370]
MIMVFMDRFANTDYAIASAITALLVHGLLIVGVTYDIFCHWFPGLADRAVKFPTHIALPVDLDIVGGVPRFHIPGHIEKCRVRHSLNYKSFVGRIEGEGCERAWAFLNETAGSTSEKSPGARWDAINYILDDWNFEKMITMAAFLSSKFHDAKKMYERQSIIFKELDSSLPPETTAEWRNESTEPTQENGRWTSPFFGKNDWGVFMGRADASEDWGVKEALQKEQADEEARHSGAGNQKGILKDKLRVDAIELNANSTPRQHNLINDRRKLCLTRVTTLRQLREQHMGSLGDPDHPECEQHTSPDIEYADLALPSAYMATSLIAANCLHPPQAEAVLRRAACEDALCTIRSLLGAKSLALRYKRKNIVGEVRTTRAEQLLKELHGKVDRARRRYNRSRDALLRLDLLGSDRTTYRALEANDLKMLSDYLDVDSAGLGQGSQ